MPTLEVSESPHHLGLRYESYSEVMNNLIITIVLLGLLLMMLLAPFSALALLMIVGLASTIGWTIWQLLVTLVKGET